MNTIVTMTCSTDRLLIDGTLGSAGVAPWRRPRPVGIAFGVHPTCSLAGAAERARPSATPRPSTVHPTLSSRVCSPPKDRPSR